jgi:hypothetical protein
MMHGQEEADVAGWAIYQIFALTLINTTSRMLSYTLGPIRTRCIDKHQGLGIMLIICVEFKSRSVLCRFAVRVPKYCTLAFLVREFQNPGCLLQVLRTPTYRDPCPAEPGWVSPWRSKNGSLQSPGTCRRAVHYRRPWLREWPDITVFFMERYYIPQYSVQLV